MRGPPYLLEAIVTLIIWVLLMAFIIHDTPRIADAARVTPSPSYWHILDELDPREDTLHLIGGDET